MEQSTLLIIFCVSITIVVFSTFYYFNKKFLTIQMTIESLQNQILDQQRVIERQEKLIRQVFRDSPLLPEISLPNRNIQSTLQMSHPINHPTGPAPSPIHNPLLSMGPMMDGLMGMLQTLPVNAPLNFATQDSEKKETISEETIDKEISKELEELKVPVKNDIKEGRIDSSSETPKTEI